MLTAIHDHLSTEIEIAKNRLLQVEGEIGFYQDIIHSAKVLNPNLGVSSLYPPSTVLAGSSSQTSSIGLISSQAEKSSAKPRNPSTGQPKKRTKKELGGPAIAELPVMIHSSSGPMISTTFHPPMPHHAPSGILQVQPQLVISSESSGDRVKSSSIHSIHM